MSTATCYPALPRSPHTHRMANFCFFFFYYEKSCFINAAIGIDAIWQISLLLFKTLMFYEDSHQKCLQSTKSAPSVLIDEMYVRQGRKKVKRIACVILVRFVLGIFLKINETVTFSITCNAALFIDRKIFRDGGIVSCHIKMALKFQNYSVL